jgi:hypothetical protein
VRCNLVGEKNFNFCRVTSFRFVMSLKQFYGGDLRLSKTERGCKERIGVVIRWKGRRHGYWFEILNAPISSCSKKQDIVTLSSHEAKYVAC